MKREDFDEDDIQGMLIAYLDEQMEVAEKAAFEKLLSRHEDLQADLELYKKTSLNLEKLFELEGVEIPSQIVTEFYQRDFGAGPRPSSKISKSFAQASEKPPELVMSPEPPAPKLSNSTSDTQSVDRTYESFSEKSNVTSLASRRRKVQQFFSLQGIAQMAAALALGIFLGPSILDQFSEEPSTSNKQPANFKISTDDLVKIELQSHKSPVTQSLVDERRISELETGFTILVNGQKVEASSDERFTQGDQYQFTFKSPESGQLRILKTDINGSSKTSEIVLDSLVKRGENIIIPAQGSLTIGDITNFQLKATLTIKEGNEINYTRIFTVN